MADETIELTEVQEILDGLSSPTDEQLMQSVRGYSERAIGSAAAKLALAGGGGGGSLPDWWTVDSTPDAETVEFGGAVSIREPGDPLDGNNVLTLLDRDDAGPGSHFDTYGGWYGQAASLIGSDNPDFAAAILLLAQASAETSQLLVFNDASVNEVFTVNDTGTVTISPGASETLKVDEDEIGFFGAATVPQPEIPATPNAQDIADVLVALGLATQAA